MIKKRLKTITRVNARKICSVQRDRGPEDPLNASFHMHIASNVFCSGIASVFSGTSAAAGAAAAAAGASAPLGAGSIGGIGIGIGIGREAGPEPGVGVGGVPGPLRRGSLLSGERAVFKPVVDRIDSLELQVQTRICARVCVCLFCVVCPAILSCLSLLSRVGLHVQPDDVARAACP